MSIQFRCPRCEYQFEKTKCSNCNRGNMYIGQIKWQNFFYRTRRVSYAKCNVCGYSWGYTYCPKCGAECSVQNHAENCFLSTACCRYKGLPDDCRELRVLREFRDSFMQETEERKCYVYEYYAYAPLVLEYINNKEDKENFFENIYEELVLKTVELIEKKNYHEAFDIYKEYIERLTKEIKNNSAAVLYTD